MKRDPDIHTWDEFIERAQRMPSLEAPKFNVTNPIEQHFFDVADKHGVTDRILSEMEEGDYLES